MTAQLDKRALQDLREALEERQAMVEGEIRRELAESRTQRYIDLAGVGDLEDHALANLLVDENLAEIHHYIQEYRAIDAALTRMERGEYGVCIDCGGPIDVERLRVYLTAVRCLYCQELFERTHAGENHPTL